MQTELITAYIESRHGSAVSDQFTATYVNGEDFEDQNDNALKYVLREVEKIVRESPFENMGDIEDYKNNLSDYLSTNS